LASSRKQSLLLDLYVEVLGYPIKVAVG